MSSISFNSNTMPGATDVKVTTKGQVTIPVAVREALGLHPNTEVVFAVEGDHAVIRR